MSKSKKNTVDPEKNVKIYGADAVRLFIISIVLGKRYSMVWDWYVIIFKSLQKFWLLNNQAINIIKNKINKKDEIDYFTNQAIEKINGLEKFRYNVIVATFHEIYHF